MWFCAQRDAANRSMLPSAHRVKQTPWVAPDETGWHVGGLNAWLHALVGPDATAYVIAPNRSGDVAERLLGLDYAGIMIHDGWSPYDNFQKAHHQQCLGHLLRRCRQLLETATRGAVCFPRRDEQLAPQGLGSTRSACDRRTQQSGPGCLPRPVAQAVARCGLPDQNESGQRAFGQTSMESPGRSLDLPAVPRTGRHQLARRTGDSLRRHPAQSLGRQSHLGGRPSPGDLDVGLAHLLAARFQRLGLPQPTPTPHTSAGPIASLRLRLSEVANSSMPPPARDAMR